MRMMIAVLVAMLAVTGVANAQTTTTAPTGHTLADAAMPQDTLFFDFPACVTDLAKAGLKPKDAMKSCERVRASEAHRAEQAAKQAAKAAAKSDNPCGGWFMRPSYCYTNLGYGNNGYGNGGYIVRQPRVRGGGEVHPYQRPERNDKPGNFGGNVGTYQPGTAGAGSYGGNIGTYRPGTQGQGNFGGNTGSYPPPRNGGPGTFGGSVAPYTPPGGGE